MEQDAGVCEIRLHLGVLALDVLVSGLREEMGKDVPPGVGAGAIGTLLEVEVARTISGAAGKAITKRAHAGRNGCRIE
jgi:hypothetical protein